MSEFDFSDSSVFLDLGVPDFIDFPGTGAIPDTFAPPPQFDLAGFGLPGPELELFDPIGPEAAAQQLAAQQLATDRLALDLWEQTLADDQLLAEAGLGDEAFDGQLWAPDAQALDRPLGSSGLATKARRLKAFAKEGSQRGRAVAESAAEKGRALDPDRHERAAELARGAASKAKGLASWGAKTRDVLTATAGTSGKAASAGRGIRKLSAELQRLPIVSIPSDLLRENRSIVELTERLRAEPENPYANLWLGEALKALERDTRLYMAARSALQPSTLITSQLLKTGGMVGAESAAPASERVLGRAFALAEQRLRDVGFDAHALHVIARVYLAKRAPAAAIEPARLALADTSEPDRGAFLFSLGRAYLAAGQLSSARRAARLAIEAGVSLGYELLAELLFRDDGADATTRRHQAYLELLARVDERDRTSYYGTSRSGSDVLRAAFGSQAEKLTETLERGRSGWRAARAELRNRGKKLGETYGVPKWRPSREAG